MSPTPEELELGEKTYRRVKSYEKNRGQSFVPQVWVMVICLVLILLALFLIDGHFHQGTLDKVSIVIPLMPIAFVTMFFQYQRENEQYAAGKLLLHLLKEKYGEALPWLVEEKQLAAVRQLETEIAKATHAS